MTIKRLPLIFLILSAGCIVFGEALEDIIQANGDLIDAQPLNWLNSATLRLARGLHMDDDSGMAHVVLRRLTSLHNNVTPSAPATKVPRRMLHEVPAAADDSGLATLPSESAGTSQKDQPFIDEYEILDENEEDDLLWEFNVIDD